MYGVILVNENRLEWLINSFTDIKAAEAARISFIKIYYSENPQNIQCIQYATSDNEC